MKKLIIVLAAGMMATEVMAQNVPAPPPPPKPPLAKDMKAPPPPPPMPPAPGEVHFAPPKIVKGPPHPPPPPRPPVAGKTGFKPPVIVNEKGYAIVVQQTKEEPVILLSKKGMTQKIKMSVWNAKPQYFENKYGKLPPPPPPPFKE